MPRKKRQSLADAKRRVEVAIRRRHARSDAEGAYLFFDPKLEEAARPLVRIMPFQPRGIYPAGLIRTPTGFFYADEQIAFLAVVGVSWDSVLPDAPYTEFDWAAPEELRVMAAMLFCEQREECRIRFYPYVHATKFIVPTLIDLDSPDSPAVIKRHLIDSFASDGGKWSANLPMDYQLVSPKNFNFDWLRRYWERVSERDLVLLRGVSALIKSDMLATHHEFGEEAILSMYIALDASYALVRQKLLSSGKTDSTSRDAARWLHDRFNKPFGFEADNDEKYFGSFYEDRIRTLHPSSKYGDYPYAPIMNCDLCHLRPYLREIFGYLVLGEHAPDFLRAVKAHHSRITV